MSDIIKEKLLKICIKSMQKKGLFDDDHKERLKKEISEIENQAEYEYFLNLYNSKIKFPKNENNLLIAYLLDLVEDFDIKNDVSYQQGEFPDIDVDYLPVIQEYLRNEWCPKTFGRDNVVNIGNYGTFGIKSALLDMTRVHGIDRSEIQFITKNLQDKDDEGKPITWDKALEITPALQEYDKKYPEVTDAAKRIINRIRNRGKHAGGTVISSSKIDNLVPVMTDTDGNPVSGWTEGLHDQDLQPVGLIKFDILAIKDLLRIANCCNLIKKRHGIKSISALEGSSDWSDISYLNDKKAIELANEAKTRAIFQFDSEGMRNLLKSGGVDCFEDLVAYTALFRPSALKMQMHERYIQRKKGNETWEDQVPDCIKNILKKTQGVLCIHEDAMVSLYNGTEKKISQINVGDLIHTYNESKKVFEPKRVQWAGFTKKDNGLKIKLKNGFEITTTEDHEILTYYGWKMAKDLVPEDLVAIPKKLSKKSNTNNIAKWLGKDEDVAYLIGLLIGDGSLSSTSVVLSTGIKENHEKIKKYLKDTFENLIAKEYFHCRSWYIHLTTKILANDPRHGNRKTKLNLMFDNLDMRHTCYTKKVPKIIMKSNKKVRRAFLAGLYDSDGTLHISSNGLTQCAITSVSKDLLNDVRKLLLLEGVQVHVVENRLHIWNSKKLSKILNKYTILKKIKGKLNNGKKIAKMPRKFLFDYIKNNNLTKRGLQRTTGISRQHFKKNKNKNICLSSIENIVPKSNLLFVEVSNIEKVYNKNFYDISLEDNHNFVANGIVVHNCYQEQCMQVLNVIGDIPLIHCEKIRKAISKKKEKEFLNYKEMFLANGSKKTGWPIQSKDNRNITFIWDQLEAFSGYGFNASHATAYTYISSRLLYLKAHYPLEFFAVTLSLENDENKLRSYKREAEKLGIKVNKCNLNKSKANFEIVDDEIYIGFSNIKGIGIEIAERIVKNQPYTGLEDFLNRATLDKRIVEPLILLGVFDDQDIGKMIEFYEQFKKKIKSNQEREKRHLKRKEELVETLKTFLKEYNEEILNHEFLMDLYNNSKEKEFKDYFAKFVGEEFDLNDVWQVVKKYAKSTNAFNQKTELEKEYAIALENLDNKEFKLNQFDIEKKYYGFSWKHPIENSPDFTGDYSFSRFKEDESIFEGGVEVVVVKKPIKKSSKNGKTNYYTILVEDEDWNTEIVIFWQADYDRFKEELEYWDEELQRGNFLKLRVIRPSNGFKSYTFQSPPKKERYLLPIKEKDYRLQVMQLKEEK